MAFTVESLANYGTVVPLERQKTRNEKKKVKVILRSDLTKVILQHTFTTYNISVLSEEKEYRYLRMMAGPQRHSVLFLNRTTMNKTSVYKIVLLIENLNPKFILYYL